MTQRGATGLVSEAVIATSRLVTALEAEVDALRRGDVGCLERMRAEKGRLFRSYEAKVQALKAQPALRASVEPAVKAELEAATHKLQTAIDRNVAQLRAAAEANRRLVDAIARAAVDAAQQPGYGNGRIFSSAAAARAINAPVTVSRQL